VQRSVDLRPVIDRYFPHTDIIDITPLTGGVSADVYRIDLRGADNTTKRVVLRIHGDTHSGHSADLEFALLKSVDRLGLPIAKPLFLDTSCALLPHPYLIIDFVDGQNTVPADGRASHINKMAAALAAIHAAPTGTLPNLPQRPDPIPELPDFLPQTPEWDPFRGHLTGLEDTSFTEPPRLLHGDFWPANLIWQTGEIAAILDWEDAALGDPISDVACTCLELRYLFGEAGMAEFQQSYAACAPLDDARLTLWLAYVAAAAQSHMGNWGLDPVREAHMRAVAMATLREAASLLMTQS